MGTTMVHVPHHFSHRAAKSILRRLAPADPSGDLNDDEMDALYERVRSFDRWAILCVFSWAALISLGMHFGIHWVRDFIDPLGEDPALDVGTASAGFAIGIFYGLGSAVLPHRLLICTKWENGGDLYYRFKQTKTGFDDRRATPWAVMLMFAFGTVVALMAWNSRMVIDSRGILFQQGAFTSCRYPYSDVQRIVLCDSHEAPIGPRPMYNLEVRFKTGPPFRLIENKGYLKPDALNDIAHYVHVKSGVEIERADCRRE